MALIRRLDHVILCGRDRREWVPPIQTVLGLQPGRALEGDAWGFSNAEFDIGDGFLGLVEPAGEGSQLHRFLSRYPEGFYALSADVGDTAGAASFLEEREVPFSRAVRDEDVLLLWVPPSATGGVLYQLTAPGPATAGANPEYVGISGVVIAVADVEVAVDLYRLCFDLEPSRRVRDDRLGFAGVELAIPGAPGGDSIILAAPADGSGPLAAKMKDSGPGIFQFTIAVRDLEAELRRLAGAGVSVTSAADAAWIDPGALRGVRVELRRAG